MAPRPGQLALLNAVMLGAAFLGAMVFGRLADSFGRTRVYWISAALMVLAAIGSALSPSLLVLSPSASCSASASAATTRSAACSSASTRTTAPGQEVGLVFSAQAVGLIVGPLLALAFLGAASAHRSPGGRCSASAPSPRPSRSGCGASCPSRTIYRCRRYQDGRHADGRRPGHAAQGAGAARDRPAGVPGQPPPADLLVGTSGCWFLLDYAYYGNTISTPRIIALITPHASQMTTIAIQLAIFVVAAVPGYILAIARMDRIGHRKLQLVGFILMACASP